jgi:hypothetical protein
MPPPKLVANCDQFSNFKFPDTLPTAFTEHGGYENDPAIITAKLLMR